MSDFNGFDSPRVRGGSLDGQFANARLTEEYATLTQQDSAPYFEATRRGRWKIRTATLFAAIAAMPSTLANLEIVNNRVGYVMVVDTIASYQVLGTAVVWAHVPFAAVGAKVYSGNTALLGYSADGAAAITSAGDTPFQTAITQTVVESGWEAFPGSTMNFGLAAATPGGANVGQVDGRLAVPYGKSLYVAVMGSVNTASAFQCGASFHWKIATLA
jgi:hypothetical protein